MSTVQTRLPTSSASASWQRLAPSRVPPAAAAPWGVRAPACPVKEADAAGQAEAICPHGRRRVVTTRNVCSFRAPLEFGKPGIRITFFRHRKPKDNLRLDVD